MSLKLVEEAAPPRANADRAEGSTQQPSPNTDTPTSTSPAVTVTLTREQFAHIKAIVAHLFKGERALENAEHAYERAQQHYITAGQHLKALKEQCANVAEWRQLIREKCGLGQSRAYELIQIADGRPLSEIRGLTAERQAKFHMLSVITESGDAAEGESDSATSATDAESPEPESDDEPESDEDEGESESDEDEDEDDGQDDTPEPETTHNSVDDRLIEEATELVRQMTERGRECFRAHLEDEFGV